MHFSSSASKESDEMTEWISFDKKAPMIGRKVKVLRKMEYQGIWNGEEIMKEPGKPLQMNGEAFWQYYDE